MRTIAFVALAVVLSGANGGADALDEPARPELAPIVTDYDEPPRIRKQTKPVYPKRAFLEGVEGVVQVEFVIDQDGRVRDAKVTQPKEIRGGASPSAAHELYESALATVREWRFDPARKAGHAVATKASAPVSFRIFDRKRKPSTARP